MRLAGDLRIFSCLQSLLGPAAGVPVTPESGITGPTVVTGGR